MSSALKTDFKFYCPRPQCAYYGVSDNSIEKSGTYPVKCERHRRRQLFWCCGGHHKFSETSFSDLWGKQGCFKEYEQAAKLFSYGLSSEKIADVLEKDVRTIESWLEAISQKSRHFHWSLAACIGLAITFLQMDELWSYVTGKAQQCWVFAALDVPTRFWIAFRLGKRSEKNAKLLVGSVALLGDWTTHPRRVLKITTDKLAAYKNAIEHYFNDLPHVYMQVVKKRYKKKLITVKKEFVQGSEEDFKGKTQNTSFIERFNLTLRQWCPFLQRKTLGYCKEQDHFEGALWINLFHYNYRHCHKALRVARPGRPSKKKFVKKWRHRTPAMAMGLTNESLSWRFLFLVPVPI